MKAKSVRRKETSRKIAHPVTAYDVARLAGVSQSAVSRAFTPGTSISQRMRVRVEEAAQQLNYRPNLIARSLSMRRSNTVGVVVPPMENMFFPQLLEELSAAFNRLGYRILLFTSSSPVSSDPMMEEVLHSRVDAVVTVSTSVSSSFADECRRIGLPIVFLNRKPDSKGISSVTGSNTKGAEDIASFLVAGRHKRYAYMAGLPDSSTSRDREAAFTKRLKELGHSLSARAVGNFSFWESTNAARELLSQRLRPDAIFCANDHMAIAALQVARIEFRLQPGKDISIVGFDDSLQAAWPIFDLTTYEQSPRLMSQKASELLHAQLQDGKRVAAKEIVVAGKLVVRGSARIPRQAMSDLPNRRPSSDNARKK